MFFFALPVFGTILILGAIRLRCLLRVQEINISLKKMVQLTFIGHFFNTFLFGSTGGDFIKLIYLMKEAPHSKSKAVLAVLLLTFA